LNRATAARYLRGREDWVKWQLSAAAGFAAKTAASIAPIIKAERAAGKALARHKLLFGVGSEDLKLAQRQVRAHGFAPKLVAIMQQLGLTATDIALARHQFETTNFGNLSFSLTQELYLPQVIAGQRGFAAALRHLAARIPPAGEPPA
jgi:hypothetical protein